MRERESERAREKERERESIVRVCVWLWTNCWTQNHDETAATKKVTVVAAKFSHPAVAVDVVADVVVVAVAVVSASSPFKDIN